MSGFGNRALYLDYWELTLPPFQADQDTRFFVGIESLEATAKTLDRFEPSGGILAVTGRAGMGKSFWLQAVADRIPTALFFNHPLEAEEALSRVRYGAETPLLLIDNLDHPADLDVLPRLSGRFMKMVVAGRSEHLTAIATHKVCLDPLTAAQTALYLDARLRRAGQGLDLFSAQAVEALAEMGCGCPRLINRLADRALLVGYTRSLPMVSLEAIFEARLDQARISATSEFRTFKERQQDRLRRRNEMKTLWPLLAGGE